MSYTYFADHYDSLTEDVDYEAKADYFISLLEKHDHKAGVTLDLACGTGSFTIALKKRGIDVFGADMSSDMLSQAQMKACDEGYQILFICNKMQDIELYGTIDTCVCTLDSINHITSEKELEKAFSNIARYLSEDGIMVFDVNTVYKHREVLGDNCFIFDTESVYCAWQNNYDPETNEVMITLDFFEPQDDVYYRTSEQFSERAYTHEQMKAVLEKAGLRTEAIYDDMSFDPPGEDSQREIYVVRKV